MKEKSLFGHLLGMTMLLAALLVANGLWAQTASTTSNTYKFRGTTAAKEFAPSMPYSTNTHHQTSIRLSQGETKTLFSIGNGLTSAGTFTDGTKISDYANFAVCASSYNDGTSDGIIHYRLTFTYNGGNTKYLDIYRHDDDKKDGLAVIGLKTPVMFSSDDELNSITQIDITCFDYDDRHFQLDGCYFISASPDFNYNDIDGNDIGNAYFHPSYLIPSNGINAYPSDEPADMELTHIPATGYTPNYDDYIVQVEKYTNFTNDNDGTIDWRAVTSNDKTDSTTVTNPTFVWSLNYSAQDMKDVTYTTVDRWGGDAFWRLIFQKRTLTTGETSTKTYTTTKELSTLSGYKDNGIAYDPAPYNLDTSLDKGSCSYGIDKAGSYIDLSEYSKLVVEADATPCFVFNKGESGETIVLSDYDLNTGYLTASEGKYTIDLSSIKSDKTTVHLNAIMNHNHEAGMTVTSMNVIKETESSEANYKLTDVDAQHFYNSTYNGDFTNWIDDGSNLDDINYIYFQVRGAEYDRVYCDATTAEASGKMIYKDSSGQVLGYYTNVDPSGNLMTTITPTTMHIKDICITKNKVQVRQNHANLADLFQDKGPQNTTTYLGQVNPETMDATKCADLTTYSRITIQGTANDVVRLYFNASANNDDSRIKREIKLDANGYAEFDISSLKDEERVTKNDNKIWLCSVKSSAYNAEGSYSYLRAIKDKDENAAGVRELTANDFHTWNGSLNATVTRKIANGSDFVNAIGQSKNNGGCWFGMTDWRYKEFNSYAELTGYKWIKVTGDANAKVRFVYNTNNAATPTFGDETITLDSEGIGYLNISNHQYFHLNFISNNGSTAIVSKIELLPDPRVDYVLEGNGVLSLDAANALMDKSACVIDVRPRVNNKEVIDLYTEQVYASNSAVWDVAVCISDYNSWQVLPQGEKTTRYIRMGNPNCITMMRGTFDSTQDAVGYEDITDAQYWHGIRSMHHANSAIIPQDYDGTTSHKVMTAGFFLVDGFPYRIPMQITITKGNTGCYAREIPTERAVVNTICVPFTVTLASKTGDTNSIYANAATSRNSLNGEETMCHFYKITDLVQNTTRKSTTAGLLQQDPVGENEYVFWFEQVDKLDPYTPYVFVNRHNGTLRTGSRMEVYTGWAGQYQTIEPTVDTEGNICQAMNNAAHKTDLNSPKDTYYLYGTNATTHKRDCWYFNSNGYLVKSHYLSTPAFRAIMHSDDYSIDDQFSNGEESNGVKVVSFDEWMNGDNEGEVAIKGIPMEDEDATVPVYSVNGILLRPAAQLSNALEGLPSGVYIVGGKKAIKR